MTEVASLISVAILFLLVLAAALQGLSASGHFPRGTDAARPGVPVLVGSMLLTIGSLAAGVGAAFKISHWYVLVIASGLAVLVAPLALQIFTDRFVDGRGALIAFAAASVFAAISLVAMAFWH